MTDSSTCKICRDAIPADKQPTGHTALFASIVLEMLDKEMARAHALEAQLAESRAEVERKNVALQQLSELTIGHTIAGRQIIDAALASTPANNKCTLSEP